ncbi:MAG: sigma-70 family RNA polymerase sigma factor [Cyclobacteriaceae bacterium]
MKLSSDEKAFEEIFHLFNSWLLAVSVAIIRNKEAAEEIVEDIFYELWQDRENLGHIVSLESYLYVAVKNRSLDYYRKHSRHHFIEFDGLNDIKYNISPEDIYVFTELKECIEAAVQKLPPKCSQIFRSVKLEGNSYKKTAAIFNITPKTVENQLAIAIKRVVLELDAHLNDRSELDQEDKKRSFLYSLLF